MKYNIGKSTEDTTCNVNLLCNPCQEEEKEKAISSEGPTSFSVRYVALANLQLPM